MARNADAETWIIRKARQSRRVFLGTKRKRLFGKAILEDEPSEGIPTRGASLFKRLFQPGREGEDVGCKFRV